MVKKLKIYLIALSFLVSFSFLFNIPSWAQSNIENYAMEDNPNPSNHKEEKLDPAEIVMEHVLDGHEFHFMEINGHPVSIPLPVILYSKERGWTLFSSRKLVHGNPKEIGYAIEGNKIKAVNAEGIPDESIKVYDFSLSRTVIQLILSSILLCIILIRTAKNYKKIGTTKAPSGLNNFIEIVVIFVRDDICKPYLGDAYKKYLPYLLTVFFFILINNILGLVPGSANVSGNIAFTLILGIISFIVIMASTTKHFWKHILWPPVPHGIKFILVPVEIIGIFTKPFALILRLFANMLAGHIAIISFLVLIFILGMITKTAGYAFAPFSVALAVFMYCLEIIVVFLQAYIFTTLTAVFIGQAREH
ncbi:MAG: F0F1 ATP synthase subunit A [Alphaproteobacteria bacterium]|nr:F0F1 ATP synthase subunit A [Alphaproteobacteria bacterium]